MGLWSQTVLVVTPEQQLPEGGLLVFVTWLWSQTDVVLLVTPEQQLPAGGLLVFVTGLWSQNVCVEAVYLGYEAHQDPALDTQKATPVPPVVSTWDLTSAFPKFIDAIGYVLAASSEIAVLDPLIRQLPLRAFQICPEVAVPRPVTVDALLNASSILDANHCLQVPPTFTKPEVAVRQVPPTLTERPVTVLQVPLTLDEPGIIRTAPRCPHHYRL
jgi:hypothetical protein